MSLGDLVHLVGSTKKENLGIVVGFDQEGDPIVEWIFPAHYWTNETGPEYGEDLIIISGGEDEI